MILGDEETAGPQSVPIQRRANQMPIRKRHRRRSIPRLNAVPVIRQKRRMTPRIRRRHHHPHRLGHIAPVARQQLNHFIQAGRIRPARRKDRRQLVRQRRRPRRHPRAISPDRVDLPVMPQNPKRLRPVPRRRHIRRVALMKQRKRRHKPLVRQIRIKLRQQPRIAHRLINDRRRRQGTNIARCPAALELLARQIQPPIQILIRRRALRRIRQQHLPDHRQRRQRNLPQNLRPRGNRPPPQNRAVPRHRGLLQLPHRRRTRRRIARQKHHPHRQRLRRIQRYPAVGQQQFARNRRMNPNAVARLPIGSHRAAMRQTRKRRQRLGQNVMRGLVVERGHKTDPARFVIEPRIDQGPAGHPGAGPGAAGRHGRISTFSRSHIQL